MACLVPRFQGKGPFAGYLGVRIIEFVSKALKVNRQTMVSFVLMGTKKNFGLASAIALALFSEVASIPGAVCIVFAVLHVVWLGFYLKRWT